MAESELKLTKSQKTAIRLIATIALVVGIFWFIPFSQVVAALREVRLGYVTLGFTLAILSTYSEAIQLWLLLRRVAVSISPWKVFETNIITRFYGQFLPSELLAATVKFYRLAAPTNQYGEVVAALVYFRIVNMAVLALSGLTFWAIEMPAGANRWIGLLLFGMVAAVVAIHVAFASPRVIRGATWLASTRGMSWLKGKLFEKIKKLGRTTTESYRVFGNFTWPIVLLAVFRIAMGIASFSMVALSLDIHLSFLTVGWIRAVLQPIMMLPVTFSGIGVREGSLVILLHEYGVPASKAVALAFLLFAILLVTNGLGGLLELKNFLNPDRSGQSERSGAE